MKNFQKILLALAVLVPVSYVAKVTGPDPFAIVRMIFETVAEGVKETAQTTKGVLARWTLNTDEYKHSQERIASQKTGQTLHVTVNMNGQQAGGITTSAEWVPQTTSGK